MRDGHDDDRGGSETSDEDAKIQELLAEWEASKAASTRAMSRTSKADDAPSSSKIYSVDLGPSAVRLPNDDDDDYIEEEEVEEYEEVEVEDEHETPQQQSQDHVNDDAAMNALLDEWGGDGDDEDDGDDDDDNENDNDNDDEPCGPPLDDCVLDHIVLAAPDLDEAIEHFEKMTGVNPKECPPFKGIGIRCARVAFDNDTTTYLEIIAPDPDNPGPIGQLIQAKGIPELTPFAFAIRFAKVEQLKRHVLKFQYVPDHISMFGAQRGDRKKPKKFERLHLYGHALGGICPFFVHWGNTRHPTQSLETVGVLKKFSIRAPANDPLHQLMTHVEAKGVTVVEGSPKLSFQFNSPEGTVKFASSKPVGFKFPGFDEDDA
jgi:Glyoxalase-like domain